MQKKITQSARPKCIMGEDNLQGRVVSNRKGTILHDNLFHRLFSDGAYLIAGRR